MIQTTARYRGNATGEYPARRWTESTPAAEGIDPTGWEAWLAAQRPSFSSRMGEPAHAGWGSVLVKGGRVVASWGDPHCLRQSASVGKAFVRLALQLACEQGFVADEDCLVRDYWTGAGELNALHKQLDQGLHRDVTFAHLRDHRAGFPVSNGHHWRTQVHVPTWAVWTGDPDGDNLAHRPPGGYHYSSGGYWRLSQALTAVLGCTLKRYLDDNILGPIGIGSESWRWVPGREVRAADDFYPAMPGYGLFVDPPYCIGGNDVQGGGGWVEMTPLDLARVGLLFARRGWWGTTRLLGDGRALAGHGGANDSELAVWPEHDTVFVRVTTQGLAFDPDQLLYGDGDRTQGSRNREYQPS